MGTKNPPSDPIPDPKKRRRVGFSKIDEGIEPKDCIKIFFVSSKEEVDSPEGFCIEPVDLSNFFEEDGKIYGYQGLKVTVWVSSISFHVYADICFVSTSDAGKGITDLKSALQDIFADNLVESKEEFLATFSTELHYVESVVSKGEVFRLKGEHDNRGDSDSNLKQHDSDVEVIRVDRTSVGQIYCRLVPLVLLLVDGSNPIDVTDPDWDIFLLVEKKINQQDSKSKLLGFAALYRFFHYPDSSRLRLGQILVLPQYQRKGYGHHFLQVLTNIAVSENVYDLTIEEPLEALQHVRTCIDVLRLLVFEPIQLPLSSVVSRLKQENLTKRSSIGSFAPPADAIENVQKCLKINKRQFLQCWEVLIYVGLDPIEKYIDNFKTIVWDRIKINILGKESDAIGKRIVDVPTEHDPEMSFVMFKSNSESNDIPPMEKNQSNPEEQLRQLVDERIKQISLISRKVSLGR